MSRNQIYSYMLGRHILLRWSIPIHSTPLAVIVKIKEHFTRNTWNPPTDTLGGNN